MSADTAGNKSGVEDTDEVRVGVLGAGFAARRHAIRLVTLPGVRVVAMTDPIHERAEAVAEEVGASAVRGIDELLDVPLDCLFICVPPWQHGLPEDLAAAANLPIYVEKPLAPDLATAEDIARVVQRAGLLTSVGYQWRYLDTLETARSLLSAAPARLVVASWLDKTPGVPWWSTSAQSGGQIVEQVTHLLDVCRLLVGEVESLRADGTRDPQGPGDISHAVASTLRYRSGAVGSVISTCLLAGGYRMAVELFAPGLALSLSEQDLRVVDADGDRTLVPTVDPILEADRAFVSAVRGEQGAVRVDYAEALQTHRLAWALSEAARHGETVQMAEALRG